MAKRRAFPMLLTNRTEVPVPVEIALGDRLLGVDAANRLVVLTDAGPRALTECHQLVANSVPNGELSTCLGCDPDVNPYVNAYFGGDAIVAHTFVPLTPAERNAAKQGWKIDATPTMGALRAALAAVQLAPTPTADEIAAQIGDDAAPGHCEAEAARLLRNAKVNQWRETQRLQAAIDRRSATYALLRATKTTKFVVTPDEKVDVLEARDGAAELAAAGSETAAAELARIEDDMANTVVLEDA